MKLEKEVRSKTVAAQLRTKEAEARRERRRLKEQQKEEAAFQRGASFGRTQRDMELAGKSEKSELDVRREELTILFIEKQTDIIHSLSVITSSAAHAAQSVDNAVGRHLWR